MMEPPVQYFPHRLNYSLARDSQNQRV